MLQKICVICRKDVVGYKIIDGKCPHCDEHLAYIESDYQPASFANMDAYYQSCSPPKQTIGSLADKNTKKLGGYVQEVEYKKKEDRYQAAKEKLGSSMPKKSGKRPFYRPDSDKPILGPTRKPQKKNYKGFGG